MQFTTAIKISALTARSGAFLRFGPRSLAVDNLPTASCAAPDIDEAKANSEGLSSRSSLQSCDTSHHSTVFPASFDRVEDREGLELVARLKLICDKLSLIFDRSRAVDQGVVVGEHRLQFTPVRADLRGIVSANGSVEI